jgi:hypothetical protein
MSSRGRSISTLLLEDTARIGTASAMVPSRARKRDRDACIRVVHCWLPQACSNDGWPGGGRQLGRLDSPRRARLRQPSRMLRINRQRKSGAVDARRLLSVLLRPLVPALEFNGFGSIPRSGKWQQRETVTEPVFTGPQILSAEITCGFASVAAIARAGATSGPGRYGPFYRTGSTQDNATTQAQLNSGEIWGKANRGADQPSVDAWVGPPPAGKHGVEFYTDASPSPGTPSDRARWRGPRNGVRIAGTWAKITATITNTRFK